MLAWCCSCSERALLLEPEVTLLVELDAPRCAPKSLQQLLPKLLTKRANVHIHQICTAPCAHVVVAEMSS